MHSLSKATIIVCTVLSILATLSVALRFAARKARKLPWLADDWVILVALITTVAACILTVYGVIAKGLGLGPAELLPSEMEDAYKIFYAIMLFIYFTQGATKISATLFFKRIFPGHHFHLAANVMMAALSAWTISLFIIQALNSWTIVGFWNMKLLNYAAFNEAMAILDLVFDIAILLLPLPVIRNIQIDNKRKYHIVGIFALGSAAVIASTIRIYYCYMFLRFTSETPEEWITYIMTSNILWLAVEACMSIIATCLPTLGAFLKGCPTKKSEDSIYIIQSDSERATPLHKHNRTNKEVNPENLAEMKRAWVSLHDLSADITDVKAIDISGVNGAMTYQEDRTVERTFAAREEIV